MSNTRKFAIKRNAAPKGQRSYIPGLSYEAAIEYGTEWARDDAAPVTLILDEGSGRVSRPMLVIASDGKRTPA